MTNICLRAWNWCKRFRYRCGYGVHSPSDFYLITFVIYEKLPYYAYVRLRELRKKVEHLPHYREKVDKLLLRLVNHFRPSMLFEVGTGSGLSARYLSAGNTQMLLYSSDSDYREEVCSLLDESPQIHYEKFSLKNMTDIWKNADTSSVMVHIAHTPRYREVFEEFLPLVGEKTCFVIGAPYADKEKAEWWRQVVADERTGVTFDLFDLGLVFFDKRRVKEHRVVNFL